jgi:hypothetical protein
MRGAFLIPLIGSGRRGPHGLVGTSWSCGSRFLFVDSRVRHTLPSALATRLTPRASLRSLRPSPDGTSASDKGAGDRTRTGDVQLGKLTFYH